MIHDMNVATRGHDPINQGWWADAQNPHGPGSMHQALRSARPDKTIHHYRPGASLRAGRDSMLFLTPS